MTEESPLAADGQSNEADITNEAGDTAETGAASESSELENSGQSELAAALEARIDEFNGNMKWKEEMVLSCLSEDIHSSYRLSWITDANMFFRRMAILKRRRS